MTNRSSSRLHIVCGSVLFAAALFSATSAGAVTIGNELIPFSPVQKLTHIAGNFCNFVTGQPTPAGGANGCSNGDGDYSKNGAKYILHLNNTQVLTQKKFVLLSILLTAAGARGFVPIVDQFPTLTPTYNPALPPNQNPVTTPIAESWIPGMDTLQFEWTIFPQPASEDVQLNSFNVMKNGVSVPFTVGWIQNVSLQSHCPEPATWIMLTVGLGLVGGASRRRRAADPLHGGRRVRIA